MMFMDELTRESLDFDYILKKIKVLTPYGKIYKDKIRPYLPGEEKKLREEIEKVEKFIGYTKEELFFQDIKNIFVHMKDLRTSVRRTMEGCVLTEVELFEIKSFLFLIKDLEILLDKYHIKLWKDMEIQRIQKLESLLDPEATELSTFYIYDCYSENLKKIRENKKTVEKILKLKKKEIKEKIKEELKLDVRPDGSIVVSKESKDILKHIEKNPYLTYVSETYMNIKFSIKPTEEITSLERQLLLLKEREEKEEYEIREKLSNEISNQRKKIFRNMASIGKLDFVLAKAHLAIETGSIKPEILDEHSIFILEGRHPKVEEFLADKDLKFTPISVSLKEGVTCITGANMGGKTVSLRLVGLLCAMAQHGLFVPCEEMKVGLSNFISSSIGDMQSTDKGLSTFGAEIKLVQEALEKADGKGIILIDELARGTNPEEGYAISKAIVSYLKDKNSTTLVTTHYDNIANLKGVVHLQVIGLSKIDFEKLQDELQDKDIDKMDIINKYMDYRLVKVDDRKEVPRDALNIARLMGLSEKIIKDAEKILEDK